MSLRHTGQNATAVLGAALAALLSGCGDADPAAALERCPADTTPIHVVQGTQWDSPRLDETLSVTGVVTLATDDGVYIESLEPDADPNTSEGLFLSLPDAGFVNSAPPAVGTVVTARGRVAELGEARDTKTSLVQLERFQACGAPQARPLTSTQLPLGGADREALENMRVTFSSRSVVTDVYRLHEGAFRVARDYPLPQPTEVERPGEAAAERSRRNWAYSLHARLAPGEPTVFAVGDELLSDEGVLGNEGRGPILLLEGAPRLMREALPRITPPETGALRIVSLNLLNFFNGDGDGGGFPTERGAESPADFERQREALAATIELLSPDVLAVQELENDGFAPRSAAADLLATLETTTGHPWAVADPGTERIGTDVIAVGLFYRTDLLEPVGPAQLLDAAPFDLLSRKPVAQTLRARDSGEALLVTVNHFKSKGGCPDQGRDMNQEDGQGCWNPARVDAARALAPWTRDLANTAANGRALILGDLNAYRMEDPVQHLMTEGFRDLTAPIGERHRYSYVFRGESGTLDHALGSQALLDDVVGVAILNINSGFPRRMALEPAWLGASDHDPVIVDVRLTQSSTSD